MLHLGVGHHGGKVEAALSHEGLPATLIRAVDAEEASTLAGCRVGTGAWFASARSVSGPEYVEALLDHGNIEVRSDEPTTPPCEETPMLWCTGSSAVNTFGLAGLHQIRGQLEVLEPIPGLNHAVCFGHYLLPGEDAVVLGASYDHGDSDPAVRDDTAQASLELAKRLCPACKCAAPEGGQAFASPHGIVCLCWGQIPGARLVQSGPWITRRLDRTILGSLSGRLHGGCAGGLAIGVCQPTPRRTI